MHWDQNLVPKNLLVRYFVEFGTFRPGLAICFWNHWDRAFLGQILARSLLEPDFGNFGFCSWLFKLASGTIGRSLLEPDRVNKPADKQTNKQASKQTNERTNKRTNKQANKQTNQQTNKPTNKQTNKQTHQQTNKQTNKPTTNKTKQTKKQANKETQGEEQDEKRRNKRKGGGALMTRDLRAGGVMQAQQSIQRSYISV